MIQPTLTVFTPTYNRQEMLAHLYKSLCQQTSLNFEWLIIDDGSTDETGKWVKKWQNESKITIKYIKKSNGGVHTAHNCAFDNASTELLVCIDSDDIMPDDGVENILSAWKEVANEEQISGIVGLDAYGDGELVGTSFPDHVEYSTLGELYSKYRVKGDKKIVYRTSVINEFPRYPVFRGEKFVPHDSLYNLIDTKYKLRVLNKVICIVDYQPDGLSATIQDAYFHSPRGFRYAREIALKHNPFFMLKLRSAIHYTMETLIIGDYRKIAFSPNPLLTLFTLPVAVLAFVYCSLRYQKRSRRGN